VEIQRGTHREETARVSSLLSINIQPGEPKHSFNGLAEQLASTSEPLPKDAR